MAKSLVVYFSQSGNTRMIAEAIHKGMGQLMEQCDIVRLKDINVEDLAQYDLIGLGSPVWVYKEPAIVGAFIDSMVPADTEGKHVFSFCTHGTCLGNYFAKVVPALMHRGLTVILGVVLILSGCGIIGISIANYIAAALTSMYALGLINRKIFRIKFHFDIKLSFYLLTQSLPLALALLFSSIYFQVDKFMIGIFRSPEEVGWYGAVYRVLEITMIIPQAFTIVLFPVFSRLFVESKDKLVETYRRVVKIMFLSSLPIALFIMVFGEPISKIFGEEFIMGRPVLMVLIWSICLVFVNFILLNLLTSIGLQKVNAINNAICVLVNIILNLIFIPLWGGLGAAITTLITEFVLFVICYRYVKRELGELDLSDCFLKPLMSLLIGAVFLYILSGWNLMFAILSGFTVYILMLFFSGVIRKRDFALVLHLFESSKF